ncbi:helix-turn-helix domain-containing protein [Mycobacteroides chelonae]|uniref:helix-turn-helix domain-containing protein n=1 Tax=Mycobacteroides chelonae TaxID=1774 RepID=UPI0009937295|nr:helix-turn-helix transcriptional regulator [Mycobacteroides chelonae]
MHFTHSQRIDQEVGRRLAEARTTAGVTVRDAAIETAIDRSVISRIEGGTRPCRVHELLALASVYELTGSSLIEGVRW